MERKQGPPGTIEDIERRTRTRIDLEQERLFAVEEKVGGGKSLDRIDAREFFDRRRHLSRERRRKVCRAHRSAIAPRARGKGRSPLFAEAEHAGLGAIGDEQRRDGTPRGVFLKIGVRFRLADAARRDMTAAGAAALLDKPPSAARRRLALRRRMGDAETVERREEIFRRFEASDGGGGGSKQGPAS